MAVDITYFVHGTTTDNEQHLATGWLPGELSELGKKQVLELKEIVRDQTYDVVFCSDLARAIDTATVVFGDKCTVIQDYRLRECNYGDYNGKSAKLFKDTMEEYIHDAFPGGENYLDVEKRMADFITYLCENYDGKRIAIVAHQAPQLALDVLLKGKSWQQAIAEDWRKNKSYQPGWKYSII